MEYIECDWCGTETPVDESYEGFCSEACFDEQTMTLEDTEE